MSAPINGIPSFLKDYEGFDQMSTPNGTNTWDLDSMRPLRESNDAFNDPEELQSRLADEGYLFFRKLQNPAKLLELRRQMTSKFMEGGWLREGSDPMDAVARDGAQCTEGDPEYLGVYNECYKLPAFHSIAHQPEVTDMIAKLCGGPVLPHPQKVIRLWFPKYVAHTTPMHQDYVFFQGARETFTCWAPVGDCPIELGPLAVLPGSHKCGFIRKHHFSLGAGGLAINEEKLKAELGDDFGWRTANFEIGDTLMFQSHMVHQALPNLHPERMRISLDNRYQDARLPIAEHMLHPHMGAVDWPTVYGSSPEWAEQQDLQYYWQGVQPVTNSPISTMPTNGKWGEAGFGEALELASSGDPQARYRLARMIRADPAGEPSKRAAAVLEASSTAAAAHKL